MKKNSQIFKCIVFKVLHISCFFMLTLSLLLLSCRKDRDEILKPLDIKTVQVEGEMGRRIDLTIRENLLAIDIHDQFLRHFQTRKDTPQLRDGFCGIGMFLDGLVKFAAYGRDEKVTKLKEYLTDELIKTQDVDGYIGVYTDNFRKTGWDTHEGSYLITGLVSDYSYFKDKKSLEAARKLADYMLLSRDGYVCGFEYALISLFKATGDEKYLDYCTKKLGLPKFMGGSEHHSTHVYGYLARAYAQLELYDIQRDCSLLQKSKSAIEAMTTFDEMDITGTMGAWEHWNASQEGIGACGETCASAYGIRMLGKLLQIEKKSFYGDMMERIIYNALFAAQSPDGRKLRYFTPFEDIREYYADDYFCCPNNYRRIIADLPGLIYYTSSNGIYVNLFTESRAEFSIKGDSVQIEQETQYPSTGDVKIIIKPGESKTFPVFLRIPSWSDSATVSVNGKLLCGKLTGGNFFEIKRRWDYGDCITLNMQMKWRFVKGRKAQYEKAALMRGPLVYCLSHKRNNGDMDIATSHNRIVIDPLSISGPEPDMAYRPEGTMCAVKVTSINGSPIQDGNKLVFTEFINPDGVQTYFELPFSMSDKFAVEDELKYMFNQ